MLKALLHKQMLEIRRMYFYNKRKGTMVTSKSGSTGLIVLFIFMYLTIAGTFYALSGLIGLPLIKADLSWIFFMIMTVLAFVVGIFGSVLSTSSSLFKAKDNEFLLSMPIPPSYILISRMVSVYIMGLIYESTILLPAILFYFINGRPSFLSIILCILGFFILGFLVLSFSCFFGWLVALISSKLRNKAALTVIISVLFIAAILYLRFRADALFRGLAEHAQDIGEAVQGWGYPIYSLGLGMSGDIVAFLAFTGLTAVLFALTCLIMSKSFHRIVATKDNSVTVAFSDTQIRTRNVNATLRKKEFKRFTSSPVYMVNCAFGVLILLAAAAFLLIKMGDVRYFLDVLSASSAPVKKILPAAGTFIICLLLPFCDIAAPSISLEGKNVWILQTLPVDPYAIFRAKQFVHIAVTIVPALICTAAVIVVLQTGILTSVCMVICVLSFLFFCAPAMLAIDLKRPMLDWTNEAQPIKQSLNILIGWLGGFGLALVLGGTASLISIWIGPEPGILFGTAVITVFNILIHKWLRGKGRILFAEL